MMRFYSERSFRTDNSSDSYFPLTALNLPFVSKVRIVQYRTQGDAVVPDINVHDIFVGSFKFQYSLGV